MSARDDSRVPQFGGEPPAHRPRRRFSQNFLVDRSSVDRIISCMAPQSDQRVVEIGPGRGALTGQLATLAGELVLVEIDRDLAGALEDRYPDVRIVTGDALKVDFDALFPSPEPYRVVGNLPYNISTPMIFHLLATAARMQDAHFLLQEEVVARLAASQGEKAWGRLSVMVQYHCRVEPLFGISPEAFSPKPQVRSRVVRLAPWPVPPHPAKSYPLFEQVVRAAFSQRRKTLRNALKSLPQLAPLVAAGGLSDIDFSARPETLGVAEFVAIANALAAVETAGRGTG